MTRKPSIDFNFGQRVISRYDKDGFFRPGKFALGKYWIPSLKERIVGVVQKNADGRPVVRFVIGIEQEILDHNPLPINGAIAQPTIVINDYVLVRRSPEGDEFWAPGQVKVLPSPAVPPPSMYTAVIYTPFPQQVRVSMGSTWW